MKRRAIILLLFSMCGLLSAVVPTYYGARSLALGYSGAAFSYDSNVIFINPALLASLQYAMSGYQYQNSYLDYKNYSETLSEILNFNLNNYESLNTNDKQLVFSKMKDLFQGKTGIYGFRSSVPGAVYKNYGLSYSWVNAAIINPLDTAEAEAVFKKSPAAVSNRDITSLHMNFVGLSYKRITLAYAFSLSRTFNIGVSLHYLYGKTTEYHSSLTNTTIFSAAFTAQDYLEQAWKKSDTKFNKLIADIGLSMDVGQYFKIALVSRNIGDPKIKTPQRELVMKRRVTAAMALQPGKGWGIFLDMDILKTDLFYNGQQIQPISLGIEKGFFKNLLLLRAGMYNDLTEKKFWGSKSNALYGLGFGFNMRRFLVDFGIGVNSRGTIKNLAVSGYILMN